MMVWGLGTNTVQYFRWVRRVLLGLNFFGQQGLLVYLGGTKKVQSRALIYSTSNHFPVVVCTTNL